MEYFLHGLIFEDRISPLEKVQDTIEYPTQFKRDLRCRVLRLKSLSSYTWHKYAQIPAALKKWQVEEKRARRLLNPFMRDPYELLNLALMQFLLGCMTIIEG